MQLQENRWWFGNVSLCHFRSVRSKHDQLKTYRLLLWTKPFHIPTSSQLTHSVGLDSFYLAFGRNHNRRNCDLTVKVVGAADTDTIRHVPHHSPLPITLLRQEGPWVIVTSRLRPSSRSLLDVLTTPRWKSDRRDVSGRGRPPEPPAGFHRNLSDAPLGRREMISVATLPQQSPQFRLDLRKDSVDALAEAGSDCTTICGRLR